MLFWQILLPPTQNPMQSTPFSGGNGTTTEFELIGYISNDRPSAALRTGWATNDTLSSALNSPSANITINLGVSIEPIATIKNMNMIEDTTTHVAKKIALDLFNYMSSFDTGSGGGNMMTVPKNVFDRWLSRFEAKAKIDPNFFMKNNS